MAVRRIKGTGSSSRQEAEHRRASAQDHSPEATSARNFAPNSAPRRFSIHLEVQGNQLLAQYPQEWALTVQDEEKLNRVLWAFAQRSFARSASSSNVSSETYVQENEDIRIGWDAEDRDVKPPFQDPSKASLAMPNLTSLDTFKAEDDLQGLVSGPEIELDTSVDEAIEGGEYWRDHTGMMHLQFTDMDRVWRVMFSRLGGLPQTPCAAILKRLIDNITDHNQRRSYPFKSSAEDKAGTPPEWWPRTMLEWASPARMKVQEKKAAIAYIFMLPYWDGDFVERRLSSMDCGSWKEFLKDAMRDVDLKTGYHRVGNDKQPIKRKKQQDKDDNTTKEELDDRRTLLDQMIGVADRVECVAHGNEDADIRLLLHSVPRSLGRVMYGFGPGHNRPARNPDLTVSKKDFFGGPSQWKHASGLIHGSPGKGRGTGKPPTTLRRKPKDPPQTVSERPKRVCVEFPEHPQHDGCDELFASSQQHFSPDIYHASKSQGISGIAPASAGDEDGSGTDETMTEADYDKQAIPMPLTVNTNFLPFTENESLSGSQMSDMYSSQSMVGSASTSFSAASQDAGSAIMMPSDHVTGSLPPSVGSSFQQSRQSRTESFDRLPEHNDRHGGAFIPEAAPGARHFGDMMMTEGSGWLDPTARTGQAPSAGFVGDAGNSGDLYGVPPSSQGSSIAYQVAMDQQPLYPPDIQRYYYVPGDPHSDQGLDEGGSGTRNGIWQSQIVLQHGGCNDCKCVACLQSMAQSQHR